MSTPVWKSRARRPKGDQIAACAGQINVFGVEAAVGATWPMGPSRPAGPAHRGRRTGDEDGRDGNEDGRDGGQGFEARSHARLRVERPRGDASGRWLGARSTGTGGLFGHATVTSLVTPPPFDRHHSEK